MFVDRPSLARGLGIGSAPGSEFNRSAAFEGGLLGGGQRLHPVGTALDAD
jgi:hypothetical protein